MAALVQATSIQKPVTSITAWAASLELSFLGQGYENHLDKQVDDIPNLIGPLEENKSSIVWFLWHSIEN